MYLQLFDCIMVYDFLLWLPLAFKTEGLRMVDVGSQAVCASDLVTQMFPLLLLGVDLDDFLELQRRFEFYQHIVFGFVYRLSVCFWCHFFHVFVDSISVSSWQPFLRASRPGLRSAFSSCASNSYTAR